jgi:hypothetical protein
MVMRMSEFGFAIIDYKQTIESQSEYIRKSATATVGK